MVQDVEHAHHTSQLPEATSDAHHLLKTQCQWKGLQDGSVLDWLNLKVRQLIQHARCLSEIDNCTENVTRPLASYSNGIIFQFLGQSGASFLPNDHDLTLSLNLDFVNGIAQTVPEEHLKVALLVFLCHEVSHISQRVKYHEDVQRMKSASSEIALERMGEFDLRSDFWAVNTLSLFFTLKQHKGIYNRKSYIRWFHLVWCKVCKAMLSSCPTGDRKEKMQRVFGYLLTANLIRDAYISYYPLEFDAELWPEWNESLDRLAIYSNGKPLIPGSPIAPLLMSQVLSDISRSNYDRASSDIGKLWSQLPRR